MRLLKSAAADISAEDLALLAQLDGVEQRVFTPAEGEGVYYTGDDYSNEPVDCARARALARHELTRRGA